MTPPQNKNLQLSTIIRTHQELMTPATMTTPRELSARSSRRPCPKALNRRFRPQLDPVQLQPQRHLARPRARARAKVRARTVWSCSTSDSSRLSLALARDVTIKKSASTTTRRTRDARSALTPRRCASTQRLISARRGHSARRLTTESNLSTTQRSTRPSFARKARKRAATSAVCAPSPTARTNSR